MWLFAALDHDDVVAMASLCFAVLWIGRGARFQLKGYGFKLRLKPTTRLPAQGAPYPGLVSDVIAGQSGQVTISLPWRALSSENYPATSSNLTPSLSFARASSFLACFSH